MGTKDAYERGREDAANAGPLDEMGHNLIGTGLSFTEDQKAYDQGWKDEMEGKPDPNDK